MFWKKKQRVDLQGRFWMTDAACVAGFLEDTTALLNTGSHVFIVTHFADTHRRVAKSLEGRNVPSSLVSSPQEFSPRSLSAPGGPSAVPMIPFPVLRLASPFALRREHSDASCCVVVPEPYPTSARNSLVEAFAASLPFRTTLRFYVSMESPILRRFGGEGMVALLARLGLAEGEVLENPMLARAFQSAQEKLSRHVKDDPWSASIDDWFAMNEKALSGVR